MGKTFKNKILAGSFGVLGPFGVGQTWWVLFTWKNTSFTQRPCFQRVRDPVVVARANLYTSGQRLTRETGTRDSEKRAFDPLQCADRLNKNLSYTR